MEVEPCPTLNDYSENVNNELSSDMDYLEDQNETANLINNANLIVQDIDHSYSMRKNTELSQNIPLIEINSNLEANIEQSHNLLQTQTDISHQENQINLNTIPNTPVIDMTKDSIAELSQTNTASNIYKIIVKPQADQGSNQGLHNIPVIEIQHSDVSSQEDHCILPIQTDIIAQALQENLSGPWTDRNTPVQPTTKDNSTIQRPTYKVLEENNFEAGINLEISFKPLEGKEGSDALDSKIDLDAMKNMALFTLTERGAIQLILNRFIYCCHHSSRQKQRWRCVEYRRHACPALVDTINGAIAARKGLHSHEYHDKKIYKKHDKGFIYQTIQLAIAAKKIAQKESLETVPLEEIDNLDSLDTIRK